jgi:hypothetical protein
LEIHLLNQTFILMSFPGSCFNQGRLFHPGMFFLASASGTPFTRLAYD